MDKKRINNVKKMTKSMKNTKYINIFETTVIDESLPSLGTVCQPALNCSDVITSFNGIPARSNGLDNCGADACNTPSGSPPGTYGQEYLCTELVDRYYNQVYNITTTNWRVMANDYCSDHPQGVYVAAVGPEVPQEGDIYVKSSGSEGHVAIVTGYRPYYGQYGPVVHVMEQNANISGTNIYPVFYPHEGCFLTANYTHSCNYIEPNNPNCGMITATTSDDDTVISTKSSGSNNTNISTNILIGVILAGAMLIVITAFGIYRMLYTQKSKRSETKTNIDETSVDNPITNL